MVWKGGNMIFISGVILGIIIGIGGILICVVLAMDK